MANPAELLHAQLTQWSTVNNQHNARNLQNSSSWEAVRNTARNLDNLIELLSHLDASGEDVKTETGYIRIWTKAVFAYPNGWQSGANAILTRDQLNALKLTANRLNSVVPLIEENATNSMLASVQEVEEEFLKREDLPESLRLLLRESTSQMRKAVEDYSITGEFVLNKAVRQFAAALDLLKNEYGEDEVVPRVQSRITGWYKSRPIQLVMEGIISAQMLIAVQAANDSAAHVIESAITVQELAPTPETPVLEAPSTEDEDRKTNPPTPEASE